MATIAQTRKEIALTDFAKNIEQSARTLAEVEERLTKTREFVHGLTRSSSRELEKTFADFVKQIWPYFKHVAYGSLPSVIKLCVLSQHGFFGRIDFEVCLCLSQNGKFYEYFFYENGVGRKCKKFETLKIFQEYGTEKILQLMRDAVESQIPILENKIKELEDQKECVERLRF